MHDDVRIVHEDHLAWLVQVGFQEGQVSHLTPGLRVAQESLEDVDHRNCGGHDGDGHVRHGQTDQDRHHSQEQTPPAEQRVRHTAADPHRPES